MEIALGGYLYHALVSGVELGISVFQKYLLLASKYVEKSKIQNVLLFISSIIFCGRSGRR